MILVAGATLVPTGCARIALGEVTPNGASGIVAQAGELDPTFGSRRQRAYA
jgi:hypothetical protein